MKICLIGQNLTNFVLASVLAKKNLIVDIISKSNSKIKTNSRTLGISKNNFNYLKKNNKNFNISAWPVEKIKIYGESNHRSPE